MKNRSRTCSDCDIDISYRHLKSYRCKECQDKADLEIDRKKSRRWKKKHPDKVILYKKENAKRMKKREEKYREDNRERINAEFTRNRDELSDRYIKTLLSSPCNASPIEREEITPELIEIKRKEIEILRKLKKERVN